MRDYNTDPAVNKSTLWEMRKSPLHYWHLMHDTPRKDTPAMKLGRAVHSAILTPSVFNQDFAIMPDIDRRTKAGKEAYEKFCEAASGKEVLTQDDGETIRQMVKALRNTPDATELLKFTEREKALYWTDADSGVECKGRVDAIKRGIVIDYKTANDAGTEAFKREALRYGYDLQAAMYMDAALENGFNPGNFFFIVQEKTAPYLVNVIRAGNAFLDRGEWIKRDLLNKYKECMETGIWPGYGTNELIIAEWEAFDDE